MKKVVLKVVLDDDKAKRKAMKTVATIPRIDSIAADTKDMKLTVIGDIDPICVVNKLRKKQLLTDILTVGPAKEEKKPEEKKKEAEKKKEGEKKDAKEQPPELVWPCHCCPYNPYVTRYYPLIIAEENPNYCPIC